MPINQYPLIMGIINLSRNSFYQSTPNYDQALKKAEQMVQDGADIIDVGAVATNPTVNLNTQVPSEQQELDILIPFIEQLSRTVDVIISVDTYRANVMKESINAGAKMINDQHALTFEHALETAVQLNVPVCLMHHFNPPRILTTSSEFVRSQWKQERKRLRQAANATQIDLNRNLLLHVLHDLLHYSERCLTAGLKREHIILDPGFGGGHFGKTPEENFYILDNLKSIVDLGFSVLVGVSRKSMFGGNVEDRLPASLAAAVFAAQQGAAIIRVHDVKETIDVLQQIKTSKKGSDKL